MGVRSGLVSFVGLGPGEGRLRSEWAAARLRDADTLIGPDEDVPLARLVALARDGKRVVREVSGDPLEAPGVAEQARQLAQAGVPIEVIPGIGARAAATAFLGVLGRAWMVVSGQVGAVLAGEPPDAQVTLASHVGSPRQRWVVSRVADAPAAASGLGVPSVLVALGTPDGALCWFEQRPLFGRRVLVTRAQSQAGGTSALLRDEGADPLVVPTIEIRPPADAAPLRNALDGLRQGRYGWVAFTSANGVDATWQALVASGHDARAFGAARLAAIGPATARSLEDHGLRPDVVAGEYRGEGLAAAMIDAIPPGQAPRVLVPRAARAREALVDALHAAGCAVDAVAAYETRAVRGAALDGLRSELEQGGVDAVLFTSSSTVESLVDGLGPGAPALLGRVRVASIGPVTTDTARARGLRVDVVASEYTLPGLVRALADSYRSGILSGDNRPDPCP